MLPSVTDAEYAKAAAHHRRGDLLEAERACRRTLQMEPRHFAALHLLGFIALRRRAFEDAERMIGLALDIDPHVASAHRHRGIALARMGRLDEALASFTTAIALKSDDAEAHGQLERFGEALSRYDKAIAAPGLARSWYERGNALWELKRPEEALASYERAIALTPDYAEALFARGSCKLAMGIDESAWQDFEHRWRAPSWYVVRPPTDAPPWLGEEPRGRSILVCADIGFGDIIQFSRYVPYLSERGAMVSFLVPDSLMRILTPLGKTVRLISSVRNSDRFDFHSALTSLPFRLGASVRGIPPLVPNLATDPERTAEWQRRIGQGGFKIGIAWQGADWKGGGLAYKGRSIPLARFGALSKVVGVRLISLQKGPGLRQLEEVPAGMTVETLGKDFDSGRDRFVDTVAVMGHLDLIVTCDTSIAHVAGTVGRPTWIALKHVAEWRWGLEGPATPWYPTARLFRQKSRGDWAPVFDEMVAELTRLLALRSS